MSNKLAVFSQLLNEMLQNAITVECEEDLRYTLLPHYPTRIIDRMAELINEATATLREKQIQIYTHHGQSNQASQTYSIVTTPC